MLYIGIDLGTSAVKILAMDENRKIEKVVSKEYELYFPKTDWVEQNPRDWYTQTIVGLKELLMDLNPKEVVGISFSGQMHGLVTLDEENKVIRPAILWNDNRAVDETKFLNEVVGKSELSKYTANIAFTGFMAPKILWMKNKEPKQFDKIKKIMLPKDYLAYCMSGVFATDYSDASGMLLLDVKNKCWSKEMLDICNIKEEMLPKLYESYEVIGTIKDELASELGLNRDVKIIAGAGDNAAAAIGTGTVGEGKCNISLGTSGTIFISSEKFKGDKNNALHSFAHSDGNYHLMGCMLSAASCNQWWLKDILQTTDYQKEQDAIKSMGGNNVYFLPYLMGERSPHNNPNARGTFIGMSLSTTRSDMYQAVLEGVVFALRDSLEVAKSLGIDIHNATISGGGAKSTIWKHMLANILNLEINVLKSEQGPALGAAILAAVGCKEYASLEEAINKTVEIVEVIKPDKELVDLYEERYQKFNKIYPQLKGIYDQII